MKKNVLKMIIIIFIIIVVIAIKNTKSPIKNLQPSISYKFIDMDSEKTSNLNWYNSIDEALNDYSNINTSDVLYDINDLTYITSISNDDMIKLLYQVPDKKYNQCIVYEYDLLKNNNQYSQIYRIKGDIANIYEITRYKYDCEDAVAQYINETIYRFEIDGEQIYIGFWNNKKDLECLEICGKTDIDIYELQCSDGELYYMWIVGINGIYERLEAENSELTYIKEEELLGIKCNK